MISDDTPEEQVSPTGLAGGLTSFGDAAFSRYLRRAFTHSTGLSPEMMERPVVGIATTVSGFNNCHRQMPDLIEAVKRGVLIAGGLPLEFPTISLGDPFLSPSSMVFRNLMAMDTEEMIRAQPMDAVILLGGCDDTVPAQMMAAVSADVPALHVVAGTMLTSTFEGERIGACTDCRRYWAKFRAGEIGERAIEQVERSISTTAGTCSVMGTASTMACVAEAIGLAIPGSATPPAVHADRLRVGEATGVQAVAAARQHRTPSTIVTRASLLNALRVVLAVGGSTNALIHLTAIARRAGVTLTADDINRLGEETPVLVDLKPAGRLYMQDFHAAGGMPALLRELKGLLDLEALTVTGLTLGELIEQSEGGWSDRSIVRSVDNPVAPNRGLAVLNGSLAPDGAVIKLSAASPELSEHLGRAVVFSSPDDLAARIDDPHLDVSAEDILVLQNAGPIGAGMPEAGYIPIPRKLAEQGVTDMVRISDARMSGTAYGTVVLHVAPEAAVGGPLGLVRTGDRIRLSAAGLSLDLLVTPEELDRRRASFEPVAGIEGVSGYRRIFRKHVLQANLGCDFDV